MDFTPFSRITRNGGNFGGVTVHYELYNTHTNVVAINGGDFEIATNLNVKFQIGDVTKYISITPRMDNEPENEKTYSIRLTRVSGLY